MDYINDFIDYVSSFLHEPSITYTNLNDKILFEEKIDESEIDNFINQVRNEIKVEKEYIKLKKRYDIFLDSFNEEIEEENDNDNDQNGMVPMLA